MLKKTGQFFIVIFKEHKENKLHFIIPKTGNSAAYKKMNGIFFKINKNENKMLNMVKQNFSVIIFKNMKTILIKYLECTKALNMLMVNHNKIFSMRLKLNIKHVKLPSFLEIIFVSFQTEGRRLEDFSQHLWHDCDNSTIFRPE